jgi:integrase
VDGSPVYIYHPERERRAIEFADRAYGRATPLDTYLDPFLASRGKLREDTERRHRWAVKALADWLKAHHLPQTIEAVDGRMATRYVDDLPPGRRDPERLGLYWLWLVRREHAPSNPWRDLSTARRAPVEPERAWTDDEAPRLLDGPASPPLRLLMEVAALTGARLDAIIRMEVRGDTIVLPRQKKERGPRTIPLHSHLRGSLAGFSGWPWPASNRASQAFTTYRRAVLGPDDPGRRRAVVTFHSWRKFFISKAERAGIDERIISDVVGHARRSMTGRYSAGATMGQMKVCVEAVKLPT